MKARTFLKHATLLASLLILVSLLLAACPGTGAPSTGDQAFTIRIPGDQGQSFSGSYVVMKADGSILTGQIDGAAPRDFRVEGIQVDATVQKTTATGYLEVKILRGRDVVAEGSVTAAFGSVTLTGR